MQQLEYLSEKESDAVQGFLFSRPLPHNLFKEFFDRKLRRGCINVSAVPEQSYEQSSFLL